MSRLDRARLDLDCRVEHPHRPAARGLIAAAPRDSLAGCPGEALLAPNCSFLVARAGGAPLGCVALMDEWRFGRIAHLFVRPEARGLGVGRSLMDALDDLAGDLGLRCLRCSIGAGEFAAASLAEALGFRRLEAGDAAAGPEPGRRLYERRR